MAPKRRNMYEFMYVKRVVAQSAFVRLCTAFKIKRRVPPKRRDALDYSLHTAAS